MKCPSSPIPKPAEASAKAGQSELGLTMIELMIAVAVLGIVMAAFSRFIRSANEGLVRSENRGDLHRIAQRSADNFRHAVAASQVMFINFPGAGSPDYSGYRTRITAGIAAGLTLAGAVKAPPAVSFASLPIAQSATVRVDSGISPNFGNQLMFAATVSALTLTVQMAATPAPGVFSDVSLDRFQFISTYLADMTGRTKPGRLAGAAGCMQVVHWRSIPYVSYPQLSRLSGVKFQAACAALAARGYLYAWNPDIVDAAQAFYAITSTSPWLSATPSTPPTAFPENGWSYIYDYEKTMAYAFSPGQALKRGAQTEPFGGISGWNSKYCVCYNTSPVSNANVRIDELVGDYKANLTVPYLATPTAAGFPGGFEVAIVGSPGAAREMFAQFSYLASAASAPKSKFAKSFQGAKAESYVKFSNIF